MPKVETFNKELVIQQAIEVFHSKGYSLTSMQDLVDATGLNRSSIYNSFGSKLDLYMECLQLYQHTAKNKIQSILNKSMEPMVTLEAIFALNVVQSHVDKENGCLINNCTTEMANQDTGINKFLCNNQEGMTQLFQSLVSKGQALGMFNTYKSANSYALYLLNAFQGLKVGGILTKNKTQLESIVKTTLSVLK